MASRGAATAAVRAPACLQPAPPPAASVRPLPPPSPPPAWLGAPTGPISNEVGGHGGVCRVKLFLSAVPVVGSAAEVPEPAVASSVPGIIERAGETGEGRHGEARLGSVREPIAR
eukprot:CAMPEP_0194335280 /NCGR_PEP_ID=MMETSP0171-20130528/68977_1 /TAXON_ID=218684 /ORGANISM="Corethron pennatum, Strain L29A3" /LENGTH=114 /DNA_ID=CAMNT_0039098277 /DNA_START=292 /DNA_END=634 /DNA_ORIENTATION=+